MPICDRCGARAASAEMTRRPNGIGWYCKNRKTCESNKQPKKEEGK